MWPDQDRETRDRIEKAHCRCLSNEVYGELAFKGNLEIIREAVRIHLGCVPWQKEPHQTSKANLLTAVETVLKQNWETKMNRDGFDKLAQSTGNSDIAWKLLAGGVIYLLENQELVRQPYLI